MRDYTGVPYASLPDPKAPDFAPRLRNMLATLDAWARDASAAVARINAGQVTTGGGQSLYGQDVVQRGGTSPNSVKAVTPSDNIQEWRTSSGALVAWIDPNGTFKAQTIHVVALGDKQERIILDRIFGLIDAHYLFIYSGTGDIDTSSVVASIDNTGAASFVSLGVTTITATEIASDIQFTGSGFGWPYGSCWGNEIAFVQAAAVQNTWYLISDTDMTDGQLNNVTHDGSGKLTVTIAGRYLVNYSVVASSSVANKHIATAIAVNGTPVSDGVAHSSLGTASDSVPFASTAILSLAANDTVETAIRTTDAGTPDIAVDHVNISLVQVGG